MIDSLAGYQSPSLITDAATRESLNAFIAKVLEGLSTPGSDVAKYFADPDVAIAGSGLDEYFMGTEAVQHGVTWVSTLNIRWEPKRVVSWMRADIAWAQIRIDGHTIENGEPTVVQYVATGVFQRNGDSWTWLYWGGGEPQKVARL
ncbi:nuclear transport factor 2 family protein [Pseudomonas sp. TNT2022 ID1044]|uniref:nuclear transport factor 2 family protein n=1 Tax=Pseudomonas sp. TNT2022 ID1044 TaxID=2942636 RepID=UPI0023624A18|nr:nuclear transport factor 2 family protein [Pseudomonas sp. TNT2022 ID1044]MDD0999192.1 nuclear transport factor 2 family protein [Pseudomonas sp. TNT2022 ID1044]